MKKTKFSAPSPTEKRIQYVLFVLLLVISFLAINYILKKNREEDYLLNNESEEVICEVIGYWHTRLRGNIFEYSVLGKVYKKHNQNSIRFKLGEYYKGKYAKSKPDLIEIDLTAPVIYTQGNFQEIIGEILEVNIKSKPNSVLFRYNFNGEEYERSLYIDDANAYTKGDNCLLIVKGEDPNISYLKDHTN